MMYAKQTRIALTAFVVATAAPALCAAAGATTYKWVDDQGVVHYGDKMPPEAVGKGATVLDKQGRPVKKIDPALTPEQLKAKAAADDAQRAQARATEDQARKDRALMQSYTTEAEIDVAKNRAVTTLDAQIKSAQAYSADLTRRQQALQKKKASLGDKPVPIDLERDLNNVDVELAREATLIQQRQEEVAAVTAKYDTDKKRWREIKADQQRSAAAGDAVATKTSTAAGAKK
jgi:hypothetical protein